MTPADEYAALTTELDALIVAGKGDSPEAEALCERMDAPWRGKQAMDIPGHPEMACVHSGLFIGGWSAARDRSQHFEVVVNVAVDAPSFGKLLFPLVDGPGNEQSVMDAAVDCVADLIRVQKRVLVHCVSGRSRSATVLAAAMERVLAIPFDDTIAKIQKLRNSPNPEKQPHPALVEMVQIA